MPLTQASALSLSGFGTLFLELTGTCNESCVHCYAESGPKVRAALPYDLCIQTIDDAKALGFRSIQLTGGDPLLCRFLPELVKQAAIQALAVEIYTNGLALTDALLDALGHHPSFAFSFYSHDPKRHDAITQTPGSQPRTLAAIRRCVERALAVRVAVIAMAENEPDIEATLLLLRSMGVENVGVSRSRAVGRGNAFEPTIESIGDWERASHHAGWGDGPTENNLGTLCVAYDGTVYPCIFNRRQPLGSIYERTLADIATRPEGPKYSSLRAACEAAEGLECAGCKLTSVALPLSAPDR